MLRLAFCVAFALPLGIRSHAQELVYLDQGWSDEERQQFYFTPQGSELIPYDWFLALEQPYSDRLFREDTFIKAFRFSPSLPNQYNPDGLPVGFVKGEDDNHTSWLGLTCAACHTGELSYRGRVVRVDGGTALADMIGFQRSMVDALRATVTENQKFKRFAARVLGDGVSPEAAGNLRQIARQQLVEMANWAATSRPAHPTGFGNWDAVNVLLNTITGTSISAPENYRTPWVPVSYPSIWLSAEAEHLLWNCSVQNPMLRQVGEVIIVFGRASVTQRETGFDFDSSADLESLRSIYYMTDRLRPPKWPEKILGKIDAVKAARGARIYEREQCATCHANKPPYPKTEPDELGKRFVKVQPIPIEEVGTDPNYARYFVTRKARPGTLAPVFQGTPFAGKQEVPAAILFLAILQQITNAEIDRLDLTPEEKRSLKHRMPAGLPNTASGVEQLVASLLVYKAAPLAGIWSTAPYLHNASVPSLYQLLLPPADRVKEFYLGSRQFDPQHVGYETSSLQGGYRFDTRLPGFSNAGHDYGTGISDRDRWDLLEYLKTL